MIELYQGMIKISTELLSCHNLISNGQKLQVHFQRDLYPSVTGTHEHCLIQDLGSLCQKTKNKKINRKKQINAKAKRTSYNGKTNPTTDAYAHQ